jgi:hypothetical protein
MGHQQRLLGGKYFGSNNLGEILEDHLLNDLHRDFFVTTAIVVLG